MQCPNCRSAYAEEDVYCRQCGADLAIPSTSIVKTPTNLPVVLHSPQLPRGVAASVGAVVLGVGIELLRRSLLARLTRPPRSVERALPPLTGLKDILLPKNDKPVKRLKKGYEVEETVVYMRRVIRRSS